MIPRECKRLAEVDFPIAAVSKQAAREKSIRHGHPSTLHLWWARRPLASCRAILLALLLPDPCDPHCPTEFKAQARAVLRATPGRVGSSDSELRKALLNFIGDFANWDNAANSTFIETGRDLVRAAHPEEAPLIVDPFAGGGSIPLEALRTGCDAYASDLNPVACLIEKTLLEDIPRHGPTIADEIRRTGAEVKAAAKAELARFYPLDPDGGVPIAYLWARSVRCEAPDCGAEIPLARSFWLSKKSENLQALRPKHNGLRDGRVSLEFEIIKPSRDYAGVGTISNGRAKCLVCGAALGNDRIRAQLSLQRGGGNAQFDDDRRVGGARLLAVVVSRTGQNGCSYRLPTDRDYQALSAVSGELARLEEPRETNDNTLVPNEEIPHERVWKNNPIRVHNYGCNTWGDLFSSRQALALSTLCSLIRAIPNGSNRRLMAMVLGRCIDYWSTGAMWANEGEFVAHTFGRQALPMVWDFVEANPFSAKTGGLDGAIEWVARVAEQCPAHLRPAQVTVADAVKTGLPTESASVFFSDPPYYDAVPYAKLANFFYVWERRAIADLHPELFSSIQLDGGDECVVDEARGQDRTYFERKMTAALIEARRIVREDGVGSLVFAHKTTEGWEALLSSIREAGWLIDGSWPVATERPGRLRANQSAALATSVHLICRPRVEDRVGDWAEVLRELPDRVAEWMSRLEGEGVRGADLVFACIGPALEIFSRYSRVETAEGHEVPLAEYLEKVWEVVGRVALHQVLGTAEAQARNGGAGALEEDSRLTALFLWTLRSTAGIGAETSQKGDAEPGEPEDEEDSSDGKPAKGFTLIYDIVRRFAQPLGIHLDAWEGRITETKKGIVRLVPVSERAAQLFGAEGAAGLADRIERTPAAARQLELFAQAEEALGPQPSGRRRRFGAAAAATPLQATTLDRVHAAMLLQASGRTNGLRALLSAEQERGPDFGRLANALVALYPQGCEERRLLEAMLLAMPR